MCDPTSIIIGASVATTATARIADTVGERREARAAQASALDALGLATRDIQARGLEETLATAEAVRDTRRQARAAAATAATSAGEAGVGGISVDLLLGDVERQSGERVVSLETNRDARLRQLEREAAGVRAEAVSRIRGAPVPSFLNTGLGIASDALGAAATVRASRQQTRTRLGG